MMGQGSHLAGASQPAPGFFFHSNQVDFDFHDHRPAVDINQHPLWDLIYASAHAQEG